MRGVQEAKARNARRRRPCRAQWVALWIGEPSASQQVAGRVRVSKRSIPAARMKLTAQWPVKVLLSA